MLRTYRGNLRIHQRGDLVPNSENSGRHSTRAGVTTLLVREARGGVHRIPKTESWRSCTHTDFNDEGKGILYKSSSGRGGTFDLPWSYPQTFKGRVLESGDKLSGKYSRINFGTPISQPRNRRGIGFRSETRDPKSTIPLHL